MTSELREAYRTLKLQPDCSDEEIIRHFKKLALKYHPDRNPGRIEWANRIMSDINSAYSLIMSRRFRDEAPPQARQEQPKRTAPRREKSDYFAQKILRDQMINTFVKIREHTKDYLYQYFQYRLYNITRRDSVQNRSRFKDIVNNIKSDYHRIATLEKSTKDEELVTHFRAFMSMIFNFYKASECLNILDSYRNILDVEAYKLYHQGDLYLHEAEREAFFDRHNRGRFYQNECLENATNAKLFFMRTESKYPKSSWIVETRIKLEYTESLIRYIDLFFG
ncbi:MAG: J domain-containing protein [Spirochaetota bacterium]